MEFGLQQIASGDAGTDQTVQIIANRVSASLRRPTVRLQALQILRAANASSFSENIAARALHTWIRNNIRYVHDPIDVETVQDPDVTLQLQAGDCDDHAALMSAMLQSIGIKTRYSVIGDGVTYLHIFPEAFINGQWTPADTTIPQAFGTEPQDKIHKIFNSAGNPILDRLANEKGKTMFTGYNQSNVSLGVAPLIAASVANTVKNKVGSLISNLTNSLFGPSQQFQKDQVVRDTYWYTLRVLYADSWLNQLPANVRVMIQNDHNSYLSTAGRVGSQTDMNYLQQKLTDYAAASGIDFSVIVTNKPDAFHNPPSARKIATPATPETGTEAIMAGIGTSWPYILGFGILALAFSGSSGSSNRPRRQRSRRRS